MNDDLMPVPDGRGGVAGYIAFAEDGATLGVDLSGNVVSAHSDDGYELDPSDYEVVDNADPLGIEDRLGALEQRLGAESYAEPEVVEVDPQEEFGMSLAELDAWLDTQGVEWGPDGTRTFGGESYDEGSDEPDLAAQADAVLAQLDAEGERRGAALSRAETLQVLERWEASGRTASIRDVMLDLAGDGDLPTPDLDDRQQRIDHVVGRLQDAERDAREQPLDERDLGRAETDLDDGPQRREWLADLVSGRSTGPAYFDPA